MNQVELNRIFRKKIGKMVDEELQVLSHQVANGVRPSSMIECLLKRFGDGNGDLVSDSILRMKLNKKEFKTLKQLLVDECFRKNLLKKESFDDFQ